MFMQICSHRLRTCCMSCRRFVPFWSGRWRPKGTVYGISNTIQCPLFRQMKPAPGCGQQTWHRTNSHTSQIAIKKLQKMYQGTSNGTSCFYMSSWRGLWLPLTMMGPEGALQIDTCLNLGVFSCPWISHQWRHALLLHRHKQLPLK